MENEPLVPCDSDATDEDCRYKWRLKDVMGASVGVVGETSLGLVEKVVFLDGTYNVLKRFRMVCVRRREFGRRVSRLAAIGRRCDYLVQMKAYLYSKRFKFVVCDYYPMGSLYDLLTGMFFLSHHKQPIVIATTVVYLCSIKLNMHLCINSLFS